MSLPLIYVLVAYLVDGSVAENECLCSLGATVSIYGHPDTNAPPIGTLSGNECRPSFPDDTLVGFRAVGFNNMKGYVRLNADVRVTHCFGNIPVQGLNEITKPSPTTRATKATTTTAISTSASKPVKVPEGHIELCPNGTKTDISYNKGFLGQYGEFCYEYVPYKTQWKNAERHCALVSSGHLTHVENSLDQDFLLRFMRSHNHSDPVWIGLTDLDAEGTWQWSSGVPVGFKNFTAGYTQHTDRDHKLNDCVVLESTGSWLDLPCGVQLVLGTGFGEAHSYVCQYNLTSKPSGLFEGFLPGFVVG